MRLIAAALFCFALIPSANAVAVHWSGPDLNFVNPASSESIDVLILGEIEFTRAASGAGLFNSALEGSYSSLTGSPNGTKWAVSGLGGNPVFSYGEASSLGAGLLFSSWRNAYGGLGDLATNIVGSPAVLWLQTQDIYIDIVFTSWAQGFNGNPSTGGFAYIRSTPIPLPAPFLLLLSSLAGLIGLRHRA